MGSQTLKSGNDYSVAYFNNRNVGTATVKVTAKNGYKGEVTKEFSITKANQSISVSVKKTKLNVGDVEKIAVLGASGTLGFVSSLPDIASVDSSGIITAKALGEAVITITAAETENHTEAVETITIQVMNLTGTITSKDVSINPVSCIFDGTAKKPAVAVTHDSEVLTEGEDFEVAYSDNIAVGMAKIRVKGIGSYDGEAEKTFTITKASISGAKVTISPKTYVYDGKAKTPKITVKSGSITLREGHDYRLVFSNNTVPGTAKITVSGIGNYEKNVSRSFTISKRTQTIKKATLKAASIISGQTTKISLTGTNLNGSRVYKVVNSGVAKVNSSGVVTGLSSGKTKINIYLKGTDYDDQSKTASCTITVKKPSATKVRALSGGK